ncbi:MAG: aminoacyl-tRNA hydrolase [Anaerolineales bacterium]|nr:aminoacyl-tRNA hydrolase [Anaerolineales bacterium]
MIQITKTIGIQESEIQVEFVQSSGPGGQNVNKVASQAQLRYDTAALPEDVQLRLVKLAGSRMSEDGVLIIQARRYRSQEQNRQDAIQRLVELVRRAAEPPEPRRKTRPSLAERQKRLQVKRRRSALKRLRRVRLDDE